MSREGHIDVRLSFDEVALIRSAFFAKIESRPDDQDPDAQDIDLAERITGQAERRWRVRYEQVFR